MRALYSSEGRLPTLCVVMVTALGGVAVSAMADAQTTGVTGGSGVQSPAQPPMPGSPSIPGQAPSPVTLPAGQAPAATYVPVIFGVIINGNDRGLSASMMRLGGRVLFRGEDLDAWRIKRPATVALTRQGVSYYDLTTLPGAAVTIDETSQVIRLQIPPNGLVAFNLSGAPLPTELPSKGVFGAYLNYDLDAEHNPFGNLVSGYLDSGVSGNWGLITNSAQLDASTVPGTGHSVVRLDSSYIYDNPEKMTRFLLGDSLTRNATWSSPVRFAGIQYGTDFDLRPNFISFPTPGFTGQATLPSAVQLYVNDALRYQGNVDQGPFALNQLPTLTGAGEMQFVVRDQTGVEQSVSIPYYVSSNLLKAGLSDYSVEAGAERQNYGVDDFGYTHPIVSGNYRRGLTDSLTAEAHAEGNGDIQVGGVGLDWVWPVLGEVSGAIAGSSGVGRGMLGRVGFTHLDQIWSFSANYQQASPGFRQSDLGTSGTTLQSQLQVIGGLSLNPYGSISVGYTAVGYVGGDKTQVMSANYSRSLFGSSYLDGYALLSRSTGTSQSLTLGFTVTVPFDNNRYATASAESRDHGHYELTGQYRQDPPTDQGFGYLLTGAYGDLNRGEGDLTWRTDKGVFTAEAYTDNTGSSGRLLASGGVGYAGGMFFASRRIDDGFAVVTIPGSPSTTVMRDNQPWATTNSEGRALVTDLRAYEPNQISFDNTALPITATVNTETLTLVPRYHGAVAASFGVSHDRVVTVIVHQPDGSPIPPALNITGDHHTAPMLSGYDGLIFITAPVSGEHFTAQWDDHVCHFTLGTLPNTAILPKMGPYTCAP